MSSSAASVPAEASGAVPAAFPFSVAGQSGAMPSSGFGTATLHGDVCTAAVRAAIRAGYRLIDTALLYNNQEAVGAGIAAAIAAGEVTRAELWITTKVAFYPAAHTGGNGWVPIAWHDENRKTAASVAAGVELCLQKLGLDYVDLLLIHNPLTELAEYEVSSSPHLFELGGSRLTAEERRMVLAHRLDNLVRPDEAAGEAARAECWRALEAARAAGKTRFIGVSNYAPLLIERMAAYATVMPAVNQLELHPRYSSPALQAHARRSGMLLTAYGSGNSVAIEKSAVVARIAAARGSTPLAVVLRWTLQKGVAVIPRTATPEHMALNLAAAAEVQLSDAEVMELDALNEAHPYYWWEMPLLPKGAKPDC